MAGRFAVKTLEFDKVKSLVAEYAATSPGKKRILALSVVPEKEQVEILLQETAEAEAILENGERIPFGGLYDVISPVKQAAIGRVIEIEDLMAIGSSATAVTAIKTFMEHREEHFPHLRVYTDEISEFPQLIREIRKSISEKGEILDSASTKLRSLRQGIISAKNRVKRQLDEILHDTNNHKFFQENLVTMRGDRYVIPVKAEYRINFPGVVHDQSGTGSTVFIEPMAVVNLNNEIKRYTAEEREEIERILARLSSLVAKDADALLLSLDKAVYLDVVSAKAAYALATHAVKPEIMDAGGVDGNGYIEILKGRHPLIPQNVVVPLDVNIGKDFNTLLITGPNTGGKTVALKAVGLFSLMAQTGMFVPAAKAFLPVLHAVYADIGDEQSIEQSLSTFSGHMTNIISILKKVKQGDLILVDEICAGTDPNEGAALAMSILNYLTSKGVFTMMTTHYSELKTFAYGRSDMENASVEFDQETLMPTYRLLMGVPGSSNAFNISRRLGLKEKIVDGAKEFLDREHVHMEEVLKGLEGERKRYETSNKEIESLRYETEILRNQLESEKKEFEKKRTEMLNRAKKKADDIYRRSRREAESVIKNLKQLKQEQESNLDLKKVMDESRKKLDKHWNINEPLPKGTRLTPETAEKGMKVFVKNLRQEATILEVEGKEVTVAIGVLKMTLPVKNCILTKETRLMNKEKKAAEASANTTVSNVHSLRVSRAENSFGETDVRGMTTNEAIPYVDKAIDDALISGRSEVRILHGKGTGALRAGLQDYLRGHHSVESFKIADLVSGGAGVTVVTVK